MKRIYPVKSKNPAEISAQLSNVHDQRPCLLSKEFIATFPALPEVLPMSRKARWLSGGDPLGNPFLHFDPENRPECPQAQAAL
jgi:hypothetical protein